MQTQEDSSPRYVRDGRRDAGYTYYRVLCGYQEVLCGYHLPTWGIPARLPPEVLLAAKVDGYMLR